MRRKWPKKGLREVVAAVNALRNHANGLLQEGRAEEAEQRYQRILQQAKAIDASCSADDDDEDDEQQAAGSAALHQVLAAREIGNKRGLLSSFANMLFISIRARASPHTNRSF